MNASRLQSFFAASITLAKRIRQLEHRANPMVNILNVTMKTTAQYPDLCADKGMVWRLSHSVAGALWIFLCAVAYWPTRTDDRPVNKPVDVLILSHLVNVKHIESQEDFYFGKLADDLNKAGFLVQTILINHCRAGEADVRQCRRMNTTVLPAYFSPAKEAWLILKMFITSFSIPAMTDRNGRRLARQARLAQFGNRALGDMRIGKLIARHITMRQPKIIVHTFEGHGWERIVNVIAHQMSPPAVTFGYQHAVLFPGERSINYLHDGGADPDVVMTSGPVTKELFLRSAQYSKKNTIVLGSVKSSSGEDSPLSSVNGTCLLVPEGVFDEVELMAVMGIRAAKLAPDRQFVLRLHPVLDRDTVKKRLGKLPANFSLSDDELENDLNAASFICYRGSSVVLSGILAGVRPIYLDPDNSLSTNDPLAADLPFRKVAKSAEAIVGIMSARENLQKSMSQYRQAARYVEGYAAPFNSDEFISRAKEIVFG